MGSADVLEALYPLLLKHGKPNYIRSDNGSEFIATALQLWLRKVGIKPIQLYPGSPWENGYNERFNGTLRNEVLNAEWFTSIAQVQTVINMWLKEYNHIRPYQSLNMHPVHKKGAGQPADSIFITYTLLNSAACRKTASICRGYGFAGSF